MNNKYYFTVSSKKDLDTIKIYLNDIIATMLEMKNPQWTNSYPQIKHFKEDYLNNRLYSFRNQKNELIGVTALTTDYDEWFYIKPHSNKIIATDNQVFFIHRMLIFPHFQGKNIGVEFYNEIINFAKKSGKLAVQVDTHETNIPMNKTILKSGFIKTGERGRENRKGKWNTFEFFLK